MYCKGHKLGLIVASDLIIPITDHFSCHFNAYFDRKTDKQKDLKITGIDCQYAQAFSLSVFY